MPHLSLSQYSQRVPPGRSAAKATLAISGLAAAIVLVAGAPAQAQALDGPAIRELAVEGTWNADSSGYGFWSWHEDGSVCLRLSEPDGECTDTGTWSIEGGSICYEFGWVFRTEGQGAGCLRITAVEGRYEALYEGPVTTSLFKFEIMDGDT